MNLNNLEKRQCPRCKGWRKFEGEKCFNCTALSTKKSDLSAAQIERMLEEADAKEWGFVPPWERKPNGGA